MSRSTTDTILVTAIYLPHRSTNHIRLHYSTTQKCSSIDLHLYCSIGQQGHIVESFSRLNMHRDLYCWQAKSRHCSVASTAFEELCHYQMTLMIKDSPILRVPLVVRVAQCLWYPLAQALLEEQYPTRLPQSPEEPHHTTQNLDSSAAMVLFNHNLSFRNFSFSFRALPFSLSSNLTINFLLDLLVLFILVDKLSEHRIVWFDTTDLLLSCLSQNPHRRLHSLRRDRVLGQLRVQSVVVGFVRERWQMRRSLCC